MAVHGFIMFILLKYYLTWTGSTKGASLLQAFLQSLSLSRKDWHKQDIQYLRHFCVLCIQVPFITEQQVHIFPSFFYCLWSCRSRSCCHCIHGQIQFHLGISFPNFIPGCLKNIPAFLLGLKAPKLSFVPCVLPFYLSLFRSSLLIHTIFLVFLPNFMVIGLVVSWAGRSWTLNVNQHSEGTLFSRDLSHKTFLKFLGHDLAFHLPHCPRNSEFHHLTVTTTKAVFDLLIPDKYALVSGYEEEQTTSPCVTQKKIILNVVLAYLWPTVLTLH